MRDETADHAALSAPSGSDGAAWDTDPSAVLGFVADKHRAGVEVALITLTAIDGSAPRPVGAHMAASADGDAIGALSGGCLEPAVAEEARRALAAGDNRTVRYGEGSPYLDIRLPCGSGLDLFFDVRPSSDAVGDALAAIHDRAPYRLRVDTTGRSHALSTEALGGPPEGYRVERGDGVVTITRVPALRFVCAGKGLAAVAFARLARAMGFGVTVLSPEDATRDRCARLGCETVALTSPDGRPSVNADPWTAVVLMFHEHEWEAPLLQAALEGPAFYVGAVGSRRTHQARLEMLTGLGVSAADRARVAGPIGVIDRARDPGTLALSVLAETVARYQDRFGA